MAGRGADLLYAMLRPVLFALEPERAHALALVALRSLARTGLPAPWAAPAHRGVTHFGLHFPNPVGLAAGLDKNATCLDGLALLGFGFIEVGTVTPRPQPGNTRPRMFRLPAVGALINRLGFNNDGVERLVANIETARYRGILGINIGKNFDTPVERAADDYVSCLRAVYRYASYVTVNVSSPNTKDLRKLQGAAELESLLGTLSAERVRLEASSGRRVPLLVKLAPDLSPAEIDAVAEPLARHAVDGVIATNTTVRRDAVAALAHGNETGGLSGAPLFQPATEVLRRLRALLPANMVLIGSGGVMSAAAARAKIDAGAGLVQIYTGLIYRGPSLVGEIIKAL
jgi:dihydroorotate dehydrogenase